MQSYPEIIKNYSHAIRKAIPIDGGESLLLLSTYQIMYRFFDAENPKFSVLHASCAISDDGKAVLLGDDGFNARGKTFCSLLLASFSGKYLSDEYCLYEQSTGLVYGNGDIPLKLKGKTADFFRQERNIKFNRKDIVFANDYFEIPVAVKPSYMVIPYMNALKSELIIPEGDELQSLYKATFFGHNAKLLDPNLDRVSLLTEKNTTDLIDMRTNVNSYQSVSVDLHIIKMMIKDPRDAIQMFREIEK